MSENRADSNHVQSQIMQDAFTEIKPPDCVSLRPCDVPFWDIITRTRHKWNDLDLVHAASLARALADIEQQRLMLLAEGDVTYTGKNKDVPTENWRFRLIETLIRTSGNLSQRLQVHAQAVMGNPRDNIRKNSKKREALQAFEDDSDDLIARPPH